jgi:hypothetical protein
MTQEIPPRFGFDEVEKRGLAKYHAPDRSTEEFHALHPLAADGGEVILPIPSQHGNDLMAGLDKFPDEPKSGKRARSGEQHLHY